MTILSIFSFYTKQQANLPGKIPMHQINATKWSCALEYICIISTQFCTLFFFSFFFLNFPFFLIFPVVKKNYETVDIQQYEPLVLFKTARIVDTLHTVELCSKLNSQQCLNFSTNWNAFQGYLSVTVFSTSNVKYS